MSLAVSLSVALIQICLVLSSSARSHHSMWHQEYVGHVRDAVVLHSSDSAILLTDAEVVHVDTRTRTIGWRKEIDVKKIGVVESSDRIVTASTDYHSGWSLSAGQLLWNVPSSNAAHTVFCEDGGLWALLEGTTMSGYSMVDGTTLWSGELQDSWTSIDSHCSDKKITVSWIQDKSPHNIRTLQLNAVSGDILTHIAQPLSMKAPSIAAVTNEATFIKGEDGQICVLNYKAESTSCVSIPGGAVHNGNQVLDGEVLVRAAKASALIHTNSASEIVSVTSQSGLDAVVGSLPPAATLSNVFGYGVQPAVAAVRHNLETGVDIFDVISIEDGAVLGSYNAAGLPTSELPLATSSPSIWVSAKESASEVSTRFLIQGSRDTLMLFEQGQMQWSSNEALASTSEVLMMQHPSTVCDQASKNQVKQETSHVAEEPSCQKDKLVVVSTKVGRLFALKSNNGEVLWSKEALPEPGWRLNGLFELKFNEKLTVAYLETSESQSRITVLGAASGISAGSETLPCPVTHVEEFQNKADVTIALLLACVASQPQAFVFSAEQYVVDTDISLWSVDKSSGMKTAPVASLSNHQSNLPNQNSRWGCEAPKTRPHRDE